MRATSRRKKQTTHVRVITSDNLRCTLGTRTKKRAATKRTKGKRMARLATTFFADRIWFIDRRLREFRNVLDPHDSVQFENVFEDQARLDSFLRHYFPIRSTTDVPGTFIVNACDVTIRVNRLTVFVEARQQ